MTRNLICDFCGSDNPTWLFLTETYVAFEASLAGSKLQAISDHSWAACETCKRLIVKNDREGLLERSWASLKRRYPFLNGASTLDEIPLKMHLVQVHDGFFAHRLQDAAPKRIEEVQ